MRGPPDSGRIRLGPFELRGCIASGGMGEVWEGVHVDQGVPVAVKVMTGEHVRDASYHADFQREVEAVAALNHPGIIMVFDYGVIGADARRASGGALVEGCPYLVMEFASRGSLDELAPPFAWYDFKRISIALLEALGHAHSRGMIHLDIKPGNVLLGSSDDPRPRLKLTDFGIAHALDRQRPTIDEASPHGTVEQARGTPWYMSPEQLCGRWRDYGPWSDIYAFGVLAWELATGARPFDGPSAKAIGLKHLECPLPNFDPYIDVPDGLLQWLQTLLAKKPQDRFQRASDALVALIRLGDPNEITTHVGPAPAAPEDTSDITKRVLTNVGVPKHVVMDDTMDYAPAPAQSQQAPRPAIESTWPRCPGEEPPPPHALTGAGLGLFNLRTIPFIGRKDERETLWAALQDVYLAGRPGAVVVRGPTGVGKSRLAQWLCERAHEAGAATIFKASHDGVGGPKTGLPRMLADHFRCVGLHRWATKLRLGKLLARHGIHDVATVEETAEFVMLAAERTEITETETQRHEHTLRRRRETSAPHARPRGYTARPADRHRLVERLLRHLAHERPLVVWIDDAHYGLDALDFAARLLAPSKPEFFRCPLLFVLTVSDEGLAEREAEAGRVAALLERSNAQSLSLDPLADEEIHALVAQMLPLDPELHLRIVERVGGSPLFVSQLVGDWVQRGVLAPGAEGFEFVPGESADLPDDVHAIWSDRIARLSGNDPNALRSIELAAALGREFSTRELELACDQAGVPFSRALLDRVARARLCELSAHGWRFAHNMLRESIERSAREAGRWASHNLACAEMLRRAGPYSRVAAERRAAHLVQAGRHAEAIDEFLAAADHRHRCGEPGQALRLLELRERAMYDVELHDDDPRWARGWVLAANAALRSGDFVSASTLAERAREASARTGDTRTRAEALDSLAFVARREGDLDTALRHSQAALDLYERPGEQTRKIVDARGHATALLNLGHTHMNLGKATRASELFGRAREMYTAAGDDAGVGRCLLAIGHAAARGGDLDQARSSYEEARSLFESVGNSFLVLACDTGIARIGAE